MSPRLALGLAALVSTALLVASAGGGVSGANGRVSGSAEVLVALQGRPLAYGRTPARERALALEQRSFLRELRDAVPQARVGWRYRIVQNGMSLTLPADAVARVRLLPGVRDVYPSGVYRPLVGPAGGTIRARSLPGLPLANAGAGLKIGIIDDGVDQTHPFFDPAGYTMPPGYPKGNTAFTTAKVIVARAFRPRDATHPGARLPFEKGASAHGTHVAGIAAGNASTSAAGTRISGVAPRAWIGNYKALGIPTDAGVGLDGNAPELVAAIEAAVADGMDVINLSLGEPEIEPERDVVALALDAAAAAGVVPVVAAGNDYDDFGEGSLTSPGSAADAITVAAVTDESAPRLASFSSAGPTPLSLRLKPDLAAPGVGILSSVPGGFEGSSGTSMAAPHVAGAAALLLQRHPSWTVAQVKSALVTTARPVLDGDRPAEPIRGGAGLVDVAAADAPLVTTRPTGLSLGLLADGAVATAAVTLDDAGGGAGTWSASVRLQRTVRATVAVPPTVEVPGTLQVDVAVAPDATDADLTGFVVLRRGDVERRIPLWGRLATSALAATSATPLRVPGVVEGSTAGRPSRATVYRYPDVPSGGAVTARLSGPERLYSVALARPAANLGVVILRRGKGVTVEPRVVEDADESRLTGYPALPLNLNPYLVGFATRVLAAGAISPAAGTYTFVFDSPTPGGAGAFAFRWWVDDVRPPTARLRTRSVPRGQPLLVRVADARSGVDPASIVARIDGRPVLARLVSGVVRISTTTVSRGAHVLRLQVSDYQETRNMENVARILPNTRVLRARVTIR